MARWDDLFSEAIEVAVEQMIHERNQGATPAEIVRRYHRHANIARTELATWDDAVYAIANAWCRIPGKDRKRVAA